MASGNKVTVSVVPTTRRPTSAERNAAQSSALATQQSMLKQEAADRRRKRAEALPDAPSSTSPRRRLRAG